MVPLKFFQKTYPRWNGTPKITLIIKVIHIYPRWNGTPKNAEMVPHYL